MAAKHFTRPSLSTVTGRSESREGFFVVEVGLLLLAALLLLLASGRSVQGVVVVAALELVFLTVGLLLVWARAATITTSAAVTTPSTAVVTASAASVTRVSLLFLFLLIASDLTLLPLEFILTLESLASLVLLDLLQFLFFTVVEVPLFPLRNFAESLVEIGNLRWWRNIDQAKLLDNYHVQAEDIFVLNTLLALLVLLLAAANDGHLFFPLVGFDLTVSHSLFHIFTVHFFNQLLLDLFGSDLFVNLKTGFALHLVQVGRQVVTSFDLFSIRVGPILDLLLGYLL